VAQVALQDLTLQQFNQHLKVLRYFLLRLTRLQVIEVYLGEGGFEKLQVEGVAFEI